jgi:hypothetical protein
MKQTQSSLNINIKEQEIACRYITLALTNAQYRSLLKDQSTFIANRRAKVCSKAPPRKAGGENQKAPSSNCTWKK